MHLKQDLHRKIMASFIISLVVLLAGYFIYGTFIEKVFGADERRLMPCDTMRDGVDFTPMPTCCRPQMTFSFMFLSFIQQRYE